MKNSNILLIELGQFYQEQSKAEEQFGYQVGSKCHSKNVSKIFDERKINFRLTNKGCNLKKILFRKSVKIKRYPYSAWKVIRWNCRIFEYFST